MLSFISFIIWSLFFSIYLIILVILLVVFALFPFFLSSYLSSNGYNTSFFVSLILAGLHFSVLALVFSNLVCLPLVEGVLTNLSLLLIVFSSAFYFYNLFYMSCFFYTPLCSSLICLVLLSPLFFLYFADFISSFSGFYSVSSSFYSFSLSLDPLYNFLPSFMHNLFPVFDLCGDFSSFTTSSASLDVSSTILTSSSDSLDSNDFGTIPSYNLGRGPNLLRSFPSPYVPEFGTLIPGTVDHIRFAIDNYIPLTTFSAFPSPDWSDVCAVTEFYSSGFTSNVQHQLQLSMLLGLPNLLQLPQVENASLLLGSNLEADEWSQFYLKKIFDSMYAEQCLLTSPDNPAGTPDRSIHYSVCLGDYHRPRQLLCTVLPITWDHKDVLSPSRVFCDNQTFLSTYNHHLSFSNSVASNSPVFSNHSISDDVLREVQDSISSLNPFFHTEQVTNGSFTSFSAGSNVALRN